MADYAKSPEVHRAMRSVFAPWCQAAAFARLPGGKCAFVQTSRTDPAALLAFEVQCNSFANAQLGGKLTLNAGVGRIDPRFLSGLHSRVLRFAPPELILRATALQSAVAEKLPAGVTAPAAWQPGHDNWCPYYEVADVIAWAELLTPYLPALLSHLVAVSGGRVDDYRLPETQAVIDKPHGAKGP